MSASLLWVLRKSFGRSVTQSQTPFIHKWAKFQSSWPVIGQLSYRLNPFTILFVNHDNRKSWWFWSFNWKGNKKNHLWFCSSMPELTNRQRMFRTISCFVKFLVSTILENSHEKKSSKSASPSEYHPASKSLSPKTMSMSSPPLRTWPFFSHIFVPWK